MVRAVTRAGLGPPAVAVCVPECMVALELWYTKTRSSGDGSSAVVPEVGLVPTHDEPSHRATRGDALYEQPQAAWNLERQHRHPHERRERGAQQSTELQR